MSNYGVFESAFTDDHDERTAQADREALLRSAIFDAREQFGSFLASAKDKSDFKDRVALVKNDMMKVVANSLMPVPGVMRKVEGALKPDFTKTAAGLNEFENMLRANWGASFNEFLNEFDEESQRDAREEFKNTFGVTDSDLNGFLPSIGASRKQADFSEMSDFDLIEMHGELENDLQGGSDDESRIIRDMNGIQDEAEKRGLDLYDPNFDPNERAFMSKRRKQAGTRETGNAHADATNALRGITEQFVIDEIEERIRSGEVVWNYDPEYTGVIGLQPRMGDPSDAYVVVYLGGDDGIDDFEFDEGWLFDFKQANANEWGAAQDAFSEWLEDEYGVEEDEDAPEGALEEYLQKMPHMREHFSSKIASVDFSWESETDPDGSGEVMHIAEFDDGVSAEIHELTGEVYWSVYNDETVVQKGTASDFQEAEALVASYFDQWGSLKDWAADNRWASKKEAQEDYSGGDFWEGDENPVYADPAELEDWIDEDFTSSTKQASDLSDWEAGDLAFLHQEALDSGDNAKAQEIEQEADRRGINLDDAFSDLDGEW